MSNIWYPLGAGRPGWRRKCEALSRLDIRKIDFGVSNLWQYPDHIAVSVVGDGVRVVDGGGDFIVQIEHTACNYGGSRPWFLCPCCARRCAMIYSADDGYFGCRECMDLSYASESEDRINRLDRRQKKLEAKFDKYRGKPKWMRSRTYENIHAQIITIKLRKLAVFRMLMPPFV